MERQYKDSGIEWIGRIPKEWMMSAIKRLMRLYAGATPKSDNESFWDGDIAWVTPADYKTEDVYISRGRRNISIEGFNSCATTILPVNSIIFSKRAPIGLVVLNREPICTNQGCIGCVPLADKAKSKYYYYVLCAFTEQFDLLGSGTTFKEISANSFANFIVPTPPLPEQQRIASYLDKKCGEIDALIALQEKMIAQLTEYKQAVITEAVTKGLDPNAKLVPSGIEWIGDVPEGWKVPRIKNVLENNKNSLRVGPFGSALSGNDIVDIGYWVYNQRTVLDDNFRDNDSFINEAKYKELLSFKVYNGDILLTTRGTIGKIAIVPQNFNEGIIHPCIIRFRVDHVLIDKIYLKFLFNGTNIIANQVRYNSNSTTIDVIYSNTLKELYLPVPPLPDQQRIASYLDTKCSEIDSLITLKRQKIESLNAYKKSIIYEAVTGKTIIE